MSFPTPNTPITPINELCSLLNKLTGILEPIRILFNTDCLTPKEHIGQHFEVLNYDMWDNCNIMYSANSSIPFVWKHQVAIGADSVTHCAEVEFKYANAILYPSHLKSHLIPRFKYNRKYQILCINDKKKLSYSAMELCTQYRIKVMEPFQLLNFLLKKQCRCRTSLLELYSKKRMIMHMNHFHNTKTHNNGAVKVKGIIQNKANKETLPQCNSDKKAEMNDDESGYNEYDEYERIPIESCISYRDAKKRGYTLGQWRRHIMKVRGTIDIKERKRYWQEFDDKLVRKYIQNLRTLEECRKVARTLRKKKGHLKYEEDRELAEAEWYIRNCLTQRSWLRRWLYKRKMEVKVEGHYDVIAVYKLRGKEKLRIDITHMYLPDIRKRRKTKKLT